MAAELTDVSGFDAVDVVELDNTWRAQAGTGAYCTELPTDALQDAIDRADREHALTRRDACWAIFGTFGDDVNRETVVRVHRAITLTPDPT